MQKDLGRFIGIGFLIVVTAAVGGAAGDETSAKLAEVRAKADRVQSYRAQFTLTVMEREQPTALSGTILFQRPDKRRIEFTGPPRDEAVAQVVVSDGTTEWQYFPAHRRVETTAWRQLRNAGAPPSVLEVRGLHHPFVDASPDSIQFVGPVKEGDHPLYLFQAKPAAVIAAEAPFRPGTMRILVSSKDGLARRLTMADIDGREILVQEYRDIQTGIAVAPEQFTFTPPEGVEVVDITEERVRASVPPEITLTPAADAGEQP